MTGVQTCALPIWIPPKSVNKNYKENLKNLERDLKNFVFGQNRAIEELSSSIKLARAVLREDGKPIGSYLFSGPTGVGKTEVARQLSKTLGIKLLRFDMSEYMERHTVSRLIGAPPGYVGFRSANNLHRVDLKPGTKPLTIFISGPFGLRKGPRSEYGIDFKTKKWI